MSSDNLYARLAADPRVRLDAAELASLLGPDQREADQADAGSAQRLLIQLCDPAAFRTLLQGRGWRPLEGSEDTWHSPDGDQIRIDAETLVGALAVGRLAPEILLAALEKDLVTQVEVDAPLHATGDTG